MTRVKICGLSKMEDVVAASDAGVDFIGFVLTESRRRVTTEKVQELVKVITERKNRPETVGVFANAPVEMVNRIAEQCHLDWVQLSGDETWQYCLQINKPIIKVLHISQGITADKVITEIKVGNRLLEKRKIIYLLDSKVDNKYGGTGQTFDWRVAKEVTAHFPVIIAGGLDPDNVAELITEVNPWGVDVSSGVETEGRKDPLKIRQFIETVRQMETTSGKKIKS